MASQIIKQVYVVATFPSRRVVKGFCRYHPPMTDLPFQIWTKEGVSDSILINPLLAESIELTVEYEK